MGGVSCGGGAFGRAVGVAGVMLPVSGSKVGGPALGAAVAAAVEAVVAGVEADHEEKPDMDKEEEAGGNWLSCG